MPLRLCRRLLGGALAAAVSLSLLQASASPASAGGARIAPPFQLETVGGGAVRLADLRGKVVLLDFWATWCAPCLASMPILAQAQARYGPDRLVVLAVSLDQDPERLRAFLERRPPGLTVVTPSADFDRAYGRLLNLRDGRLATGKTVNAALPSWILIDRAGRIVSIHAAAGEEPLVLADIAALLGPGKQL